MRLSLSDIHIQITCSEPGFEFTVLIPETNSAEGDYVFYVEGYAEVYQEAARRAFVSWQQARRYVEIGD